MSEVGAVLPSARLGERWYAIQTEVLPRRPDRSGWFDDVDVAGGFLWCCVSAASVEAAKVDLATALDDAGVDLKRNVEAYLVQSVDSVPGRSSGHAGFLLEAMLGSYVAFGVMHAYPSEDLEA